MGAPGQGEPDKIDYHQNGCPGQIVKVEHPQRDVVPRLYGGTQEGQPPGQAADLLTAVHHIGVPYPQQQPQIDRQQHADDDPQQREFGEPGGIIVAGEDDGTGPGQHQLDREGSSQDTDAKQKAAHADIFQQPDPLPPYPQQQRGQQKKDDTHRHGHIHQYRIHDKKAKEVQQPHKDRHHGGHPHAQGCIPVGIRLVAAENLSMLHGSQFTSSFQSSAHLSRRCRNRRCGPWSF